MATATEEREDWLERIGEVVGVTPGTINQFIKIVESGTISKDKIESLIKEYRAQKTAEKEELERIGAQLEAAIEIEEESNKPDSPLGEQPVVISGVVPLPSMPLLD